MAEVKFKKEYLFTDLATYNLYKAKEDKIYSNLKELRKTASKVLGAGGIENHVEFMIDPIDYLINEYWFKFGKNHNPAHADKRKVFLNNNDVNLTVITSLQLEIQKLIKEMKDYAPIIHSEGVKSKLKEESFFKYLNPNKAKEYHALKNFVDASNELVNNYGASGAIHLLRFTNGLKMDGLRAAIELYKFI